MKEAKVLNHGNLGIGGTTIMDDGTKCHWTEGRSSRMVIVSPDGTKTILAVYDDEARPYLMEDGVDDSVEIRMMTPAEEAEWEAARAAECLSH
jgi:hypothetical protein